MSYDTGDPSPSDWTEYRKRHILRSCIRETTGFSLVCVTHPRPEGKGLTDTIGMGLVLIGLYLKTRN